MDDDKAPAPKPLDLGFPSLWPIARVIDEVGHSKSTIYEMIRAERFPPPIKVTGKMARWDSREVRAYILRVIENAKQGASQGATIGRKRHQRNKPLRMAG